MTKSSNVHRSFRIPSLRSVILCFIISYSQPKGKCFLHLPVLSRRGFRHSYLRSARGPAPPRSALTAGTGRAHSPPIFRRMSARFARRSIFMPACFLRTNPDGVKKRAFLCPVFSVRLQGQLFSSAPCFPESFPALGFQHAKTAWPKPCRSRTGCDCSAVNRAFCFSRCNPRRPWSLRDARPRRKRCSLPRCRR